MANDIYEIKGTGLRELSKSIVDNLKHLVGPNDVINNEKVIELARRAPELISATQDSVELLESMCCLLQAIDIYDPSADLTGVCRTSIVAIKIFKELISRNDPIGCMPMLITFRDRLFELYLIDPNYYRHIAASFYLAMDFEPWAGIFGFYDARHIYDPSHAVGSQKAIDADYVIIPEFICRIAIELAKNGYRDQFLHDYEETIRRTDSFWEMTSHDLSHFWGRWVSRSNSVYKEAIRDYDVDHKTLVDQKWHGLAYLTAITHKQYGKQKRVARTVGCSDLRNVKDIRQFNTPSWIGIILCMVPLIYIVVRTLLDGSILGLGFLAICFVMAYMWIFHHTAEQRREITRAMTIARDREYALNMLRHIDYALTYKYSYLTYYPFSVNNFLLRNPELRWLL